MNKELELQLLTICEELLPETKLRSNKKLLTLLAEIRKRLEK